MGDMTIDVWLYGGVARYAREAKHRSFANLKVHLPGGSSLSDLLVRLGVPTQERGITFINGQLSAMPGLQADLNHVLHDGDRVGFFDPKSMWPFQYRHGAALTEELAQAMASEGDQGLHHTYGESDEES
jgi:hypothetical protein